MTASSPDPRIEFWKCTLALASFTDARIFLEELSSQSLEMDSPIRKALSISFLTTYARPFKQRKEIKLSADIVPQGFQKLHADLIEMRDKVVAHRDLDGPMAKWGSVNQVSVSVTKIAASKIQFKPNTYSPIMSNLHAEERLPLIDCLLKLMRVEFEKHFTKELLEKLPIGIHALNLGEPASVWFLRSE